MKRRRLPRIRRGVELEEALTDYSNMMSSNNHKFITSIFTNDVERLLSRRYNAISEKSNTLQGELLEKITKIIQTQNEETLKQIRVNKINNNKISFFDEEIEPDRLWCEIICVLVMIIIQKVLAKSLIW